MKKILKHIAASLIVFSCVVYPVLAEDIIGTEKAKGVAGTAGYTNLTDTQFVSVVATGISIVLGTVGLLFLVFMIYAGFLWMTARGDDEKIKKATGIIKTSVVGLIILLSSYAISNFIIARVNK